MKRLLTLFALLVCISASAQQMTIDHDIKDVIWSHSISTTASYDAY